MEWHDEKVRAFYDATAQSWADSWYENESMLPLLERFLSLLPRQPSVLDLGCGAGYESMRLARLGARVTGVDLSPRSLDIARERNPGIAFHCASMLDMDGVEGRFDGIAAIASLIHIPGDKLPLAFRNIRAHLAPNGYVLVVFVRGEGYSKERSETVIDGKAYDRRFYKHQPDVLCSSAKGEGVSFVDEWELPGETAHGDWAAYVFRSEEG